MGHGASRSQRKSRRFPAEPEVVPHDLRRAGHYRDHRYRFLLIPCEETTDMSPERTVAELLAEYLRQAGVTHVFGYPGESLIDFIEAARVAGPEVVSAIREASAAFMAEGAAMRTGTVGACLSTLGPGSTALLGGVASAQLDRGRSGARR